MHFIKKMLQTCVVVFCFVMYCSAIWSNTLNTNSRVEKQLILDLHNWYRAQVSRGEVYHQPEAADMTVMEWDDRLAEIAQSQAQYCKSTIAIAKRPKNQLASLHNKIFGELSMNEFFTDRTENYFYLAISSWFKSHVDFSYDNGTCNGSKCQQYKNMIFSDSFIVGCDSHPCRNGLSVVCVYANSEKNNLKNHLYKRGLSCTSCPQDFSHCMDGSLCASKSHCRNSRITKTCRCLVLREICFKHGDFDPNRCRCRCQPGWTGLNCEKKCEDSSPLCSDRQLACTDPIQKNYMFESCRTTCKWCQNNPNSIPIFNEHKLKINTIYDPSNFELSAQEDMSCKDSKLECAAWASNGFCDKQSVRRVCQLTCNVCGEIEKPTPQMNSCRDHPTCVSDFAPYCNTMPQIFTKCPQLCGRCTASSTSVPSTETLTSSSIKEGTSLFQSTRLIERKSNEEDFCSETLERQETCNSILMSNLCTKEDMNELCPITCKHPFCQKVSSPVTRKLSTINRVSTFTSDSEVCKFLPCNSPGVRNFCTIKCAGFTLRASNILDYDDPSYCNVYPCSIPFVNKVCKKCDDPEICITLDCAYNGVPKFCKKKCEAMMSRPTPTFPSTQTTLPTTSKSSTTLKPSTIIPSDPLVCNSLPCASENIIRICPRKCGSSTSTVIATKSTDPALCAFIPCTIAQSELACPAKCASSTTLQSTLTSSTVPGSTTISTSTTTPEPTDPPFCVELPCNIPQVKSLCPVKCSSTTTIMATKPPDDPICSFLPCDQPQIRLACPNKCAFSLSEIFFTTTRSPAIRSTPSIEKPSDQNICATLACSLPFMKSICPNKCGSTTPKVSSTLIVSSKQTDHPLCVIWSCSFVAIGSLCPNKCVSSTSISTRSTTEKPTDPPFCPSFPCSFPQVKAVCPLKCGLATTRTTTVPTSTVSTTLSRGTSTKPTDFPMCIFVICDSEDARMACPVKCGEYIGSTTSKLPINLEPIPISALSTKPTDFPMCIFVNCDSEEAEMACPIKCASKTSISRASTTVEPTDPPFCAGFPCELSHVKIICPLKCGLSTPEMTTTSSIIKSNSVTSRLIASRTTKTMDPPFCADFSCEFSQIKIACPLKCGLISSQESSVSSSTMTTDDPICAHLPCSNAGVRDMCKRKCGNQVSVVNPNCEYLSCSNDGVREMCPMKCDTTTSGPIKSTTTNPIDPPFCVDFPCEFPEIRRECPLKCGPLSSRAFTESSSTKTSSETSRPITSKTPKPIDPSICDDFSCEFPEIKIACPLKCGFSKSRGPTASSSTITNSVTSRPTLRITKPIDPPFCDDFSCEIPQIKIACPLKCDFISSKESTAASSSTMTNSVTSRPTTSRTKLMDPPFCADFSCEFPQIKFTCPLKCGAIISRKSSILSSTKTNSVTSKLITSRTTKTMDPPFCADFSCEFPQIKFTCPLKCGSVRSRDTSVSSSTMTNSMISRPITSTTTRPIDPPFCAVFPCEFPEVKTACPSKCGSMKNHISGLPRIPNIEKKRRTSSRSSTPINHSTSKSTYISSVTSTSTFPTKSSTSSFLAKSSTDPSFCLIFSCNIAGMTYACPNKCGSTTISYII